MIDNVVKCWAAWVIYQRGVYGRLHPMCRHALNVVVATTNRNDALGCPRIYFYGKDYIYIIREGSSIDR